MYQQTPQPNPQAIQILSQELNSLADSRLQNNIVLGRDFANDAYRTGLLDRLASVFDQAFQFNNRDASGAAKMLLFSEYIKWLDIRRVQDPTINQAIGRTIMEGAEAFHSWLSGGQTTGYGYVAPLVNSAPVRSSYGGVSSSWGGGQTQQPQSYGYGASAGLNSSAIESAIVSRNVGAAPIQNNHSYSSQHTPQNYQQQQTVQQQTTPATPNKVVSSLLARGAPLYIPGYVSEYKMENNKIKQILIPGGSMNRSNHEALTIQRAIADNIDDFTSNSKIPHSYISMQKNKDGGGLSEEKVYIGDNSADSEFDIDDPSGDSDYLLMKEFKEIESDDGDPIILFPSIEHAIINIQTELDDPNNTGNYEEGDLVVTIATVATEIPAGPLNPKMFKGIGKIASVSDAVRLLQRLPDCRTTRWLDEIVTNDYNCYIQLRAGADTDSFIDSARDLPSGFNVEEAVGDLLGDESDGYVDMYSESRRIASSWAGAISFIPETNERMICYAKNYVVGLFNKNFSDLPLQFSEAGSLRCFTTTLGNLGKTIYYILSNRNTDFFYMSTEDGKLLEFSKDFHGGISDMLYVRICNDYAKYRYINELTKAIAEQ